MTKLTQQQIATINNYITSGDRANLFEPYIQASNDKAVLDLLTATKTNIPGLVPKENILAVLHTFIHGSNLPVWYLINKSANGDVSESNPEGLKASCFMMVEVAKAEYPNVDLALSVLQTTLDVLVSAGLLTSGQKDIINQTGYRKLSYVEDLLGFSAESLYLDLNDISYILRGV